MTSTGQRQAARIAFASGIIVLAVMGLVFGDFAQFWYSANELPAAARHGLADASAVLMLICTVGLFVERAARMSARVLFWDWVAIVLAVKIPVVVRHPLVEVAWQDLSQFVVIIAGAWMLAVAADGERRATRGPEVLFGLALVPLGLAHFFYLGMTAPLVPAWLPAHAFWAYFTGAAQIAAGVGVLVGVYAQLAAALDAVLLASFTFLVWIPLIAAKPRAADLWSEFTASWAICAGAWVVAAYMDRPEKSRSVSP